MKHLIRGRQTAAMIVAVLALVAAVTGAAVASPGASTSAALTKKKVKKIATNVANQRIAALAPTLAVKSAQTATNANSLVMRAQIAGAGASLTNAQGIGGVTHPFTGTYCLTGLAATPKGGVVTIDFNDSLFEVAQLGLGDNGGNCPAGTGAFIFTFTPGAGSDNAGTFVTLWS
ncbi:MAG: hypothetical protein ACRDK5_02605 [Solirubrobacterales bacterium]